ncbi:hypothetical protein ACFSC6_00070 [Rufibacter sediminis]|uniref:hypothetical protein n=1 Tax=Rufibacter sediminis TaxID=2762756 RepID=UPI00210C12A1|nr:hypothetical protein [Rufibacter sediminis]
MAKKKSDLQALLSDADGIKGALQAVEKPIEANPEIIRVGSSEEPTESGISENDYLESRDLHLPFSTAIRADLYLKLKRVEYWDRTTIKKIIETVVEDYVNSTPTSKKSLPEGERAKLKQLKTAKDYNKSRNPKG